MMPTLNEYCRRLGWNPTELSRQAGIDYKTARKAIDGEAIRPGPARAIANALSQALGQRVNVGDINGLRVE